MALGLALLSVVRSFVHQRLSWTHAAHWVIEQGLPYDGAEFADAYGLEWDRQEKAVNLLELASDVVPGAGQISERPFRQFAKYHISGEVNVWNRATGEVQAIWTHVYTDRLLEMSEYNEMLIEAYQVKEEWIEKYGIGRGSLIVNAKVQGMEHNKDWAW